MKTIKLKKETNNGKQTCCSCGNEFPEDKIEFAPDPYASEIAGDYTEIWMCDRCRYQATMDI